MSSQLKEIKRAVAVANRVLADQGLAQGVYASLGHASQRVPDDPTTFVVKGRGYALDALARVKGRDMVLCDLDGTMLDGPAGSTPCFEVMMHAAIYRRRPDVASVVHVHPPFTTVMGVLGAPLRPMGKPGDEVAHLLSRPLPVYPHWKTVESESEGTEVAEALGEGKIVILLGHGATTAGGSLADAVMTMLELEEQARLNWYAYCAAGPNHAYVSSELLRESLDRPATAELPHFKSLLAGADLPSGNGAWEHFVERVS